MDVAASSTATADRRLAAAVGRDARLELVFGTRGARTVLLHGYAEPPFRLSRPFERAGEVHLILTSSAPGIFGGDRLRQSVRVERGARVRLTSQSALQVHPGHDDSPAWVDSHFEVEDEARLNCLWLPLIPFAHARLTQRIAVSVAAAGTCYWSDAFMAGRNGMGERWRFSRLDHELRVERNGSLEYLERYDIDSSATLMNRWTAGDCAYFGSTIVSGPVCARERVEGLHAALAAQAGVHAAVDVLGPTLCVARLAAASGPGFHAARAAIDRSLEP